MAAASSSRSMLGLRTALKPNIVSRQHLTRTRAIHTLPPLPKNLQAGEGCAPLFKASTVDWLWHSWQKGLLKDLNGEVKGTRWENSSIVETVIGTASDPHNILAFNYASLALNNSFFLNNLKPKTLPAGILQYDDAPHPEPNTSLRKAIEKNFGTMIDFKLAFSTAAYHMSGSGYVWLAMDRHENLGIVPTYAAGTLLVQNRTQRDGARSEWLQASVNKATPSLDSGSSSSPASRGSQSSSARRMSTSARVQVASSPYNIEGIESRGEELYPLLCISVHERDWLLEGLDFEGMAGKERYLMQYWECVDWDRVSNLWTTYKNAM